MFLYFSFIDLNAWLFFKLFFTTTVLSTDAALLGSDESLHFLSIISIFRFDPILTMVSESRVPMGVIQGRTVFGLVGVIVSIFIASTHLNLFNFKTLFVDFEELVEVLGMTIATVFDWLFGKHFVGKGMFFSLFLVLGVYL